MTKIYNYHENSTQYAKAWVVKEYGSFTLWRSALWDDETKLYKVKLFFAGIPVLAGNLSWGEVFALHKFHVGEAISAAIIEAVIAKLSVV